jgi:hypothetical protein
MAELSDLAATDRFSTHGFVTLIRGLFNPWVLCWAMRAETSHVDRRAP